MLIVLHIDRQITVNDLPVGRNVDEIIRLIKAFQFVEEHGEVCPANWQPGDITMSADPVLSKKYFSGSISYSVLTATVPSIFVYCHHDYVLKFLTILLRTYKNKYIHTYGTYGTYEYSALQ